jgi:tRNA threonylcarbamoyladenosine biosynthesis protein TsaB
VKRWDRIPRPVLQQAVRHALEASGVVLAIDTTSEFGSIALVHFHRVLEEVPLDSPDGFAHVVFQAIERLLERHALELTGLTGFAAAAGPGSFTGVRVGLTAVKGLAEATGRPVVAVSNLQALAWFGSRALRAPVIDARRGAVYGAVYDASLLTLVQQETVSPFQVWQEALPGGDLEIVTNGFPLSEELVSRPVIHAPRCLAGAVGRIAAARLALSLGQDPAEVDANYVRRSDAEMAWVDARGAESELSVRYKSRKVRAGRERLDEG